MSQRISLIPGDGIGPEITEATLRILEKSKAPLEFDEIHAGELALNDIGALLPDPTLQTIKDNGITLKGPSSQPPSEEGRPSLDRRLRQNLDLDWVGQRFVDLPLQGQDSGYDFYLFNAMAQPETLGIEKKLENGDVHTQRTLSSSALDQQMVRLREDLQAREIGTLHFLYETSFFPRSETLVRDRLLAHAKNSSLSIVEKDEESLVQLLASDTSSLQALLCSPFQSQTMAFWMNRYFDRGQCVVPSMSFGHEAALFEPAHGAYPEWVGTAKANPTAMILASCLMLQHMGHRASAKMIEDTLFRCLQNQKARPVDMGGSSTTKEFTENILKELGS